MNKIRFNIKELSLHIGVWSIAVLFIAQFSDMRFFRFWYPLIQFALIFYLNYFLLFNRILLRKQYFLFAVINILLVVFFRFDWWVHELFDNGAHLLKPDNHKYDIRGGINHGWMDGLNGLFALFLPTVLATGIRIIQYRTTTKKIVVKQAVVEGKYIFVRSEYKLVKIVLDDVLCFESMKDYVKIWRKSAQHPTLTLMSLKSLETTLPQDKFMRIHRSFIIALNEIQAVERNQVVLSDGKRIAIAEQYKDVFFDFINRNCKE
jgi:hypothetical protein